MIETENKAGYQEYDVRLTSWQGHILAGDSAGRQRRLLKGCTETQMPYSISIWAWFCTSDVGHEQDTAKCAHLTL